MIKGFLKLQSFFGVSNISKIDSILLHIVFTGRSKPWLRDCPKISMLPRYKEFQDGAKFYTVHLGPNDLADRILWVVDTLDGDWKLTGGYLYLHSDADIVYYRLRWPEQAEKSS